MVYDRLTLVTSAINPCFISKQDHGGFLKRLRQENIRPKSTSDCLKNFLLLQFGNNAWWRHQMETFSALLAICAGNSPVPGEFPTQRPVTRSFDVFFDLHPNKRLSKQWWNISLTKKLTGCRTIDISSIIHWLDRVMICCEIRFICYCISF